jgi:hypothetical protein
MFTTIIDRRGGPMKNRLLRVLALCVAGWSLIPVAAFAQDVAGTLNTAWESFWQQSGYPRATYKWQTPIRVRFSGASVERHKEHTLRQLRAVTELTGITLTEAAADDTTANLQIEYFGTAAPLPPNQPCVTNVTPRDFAIVRATIKANDQDVWRCMLHESMHLMGIPGHPLYNTILTYFARGNQLTDVDKLLLKTIYSDTVAPGASPFAVLDTMAQRIVDSATDTDKNTSRQAADVFLRDTIQAMENFANGKGEAPTVIVRSGKATAQGMARGRTDIQYFLGLAYTHGHIVKPDKEKAIGWLQKAAAASHGGAATQLKLAATAEKN